MQTDILRPSKSFLPDGPAKICEHIQAKTVRAQSDAIPNFLIGLNLKILSGKTPKFWGGGAIN